MRYFYRHWRGELSLPVAFWLNNTLLLYPLGLAVGLAMAWAASWGQDLQTLAWISLVGIALLVAISFWAPLGAWRSATRHVEEFGSRGWALAAKLVLGLGLCGNVIGIAVDLLPNLREQWQLALGRDPIGRLDIALAPDGRTATLRGAFGMGAARRFQQMADRAPRLRRVTLESPGGRLYEAHEIAQTVRRRGLQTRADGDCASACTLVFVAGRQRSLVDRARLGFHRASVPGLNPLYDELANRRLAELYTDAGLPQDFVARVLQTPARRMWFPPVQSLVSAGILPTPTLQPEIDAALPADAPPARYRESLTENPLWVELERRRPGVLDLAADRMSEERRRGASPESALQAARGVARSALPDVLQTAAPPAQEAFLQALGAELRERRAGGDRTCQAALTDAQRTPARLDDWMRTALTEAAPMSPRRAVSPLEVEVLRRELGTDAPDRIAALVLAPSGRKQESCDRAIGLLDAMARLRGPQRALAVRLMLQAAGPREGSS